MEDDNDQTRLLVGERICATICYVCNLWWRTVCITDQPAPWVLPWELGFAPVSTIGLRTAAAAAPQDMRRSALPYE